MVLAASALLESKFQKLEHATAYKEHLGPGVCTLSCVPLFQKLYCLNDGIKILPTQGSRLSVGMPSTLQGILLVYTSPVSTASALT